METKQIKERILSYRNEGKSLFVSSSFQTHSIPLLHIISEIDRSIPVVFINTGFHFPSTLKFRDQISDKLGLSIIDLRSEISRIQQRGSDGRFFYTSDPDHCCHINKVAPLDSLLFQYDVWINGVRRDQSKNRAAMDYEQKAPHNTIRFHPLLDWNSKMIWDYRKKHQLPEHPLANSGYMSIGCEPCTRRIDPENMEREARWFGLNKSECGLHTELVSK